MTGSFLCSFAAVFFVRLLLYIYVRFVYSIAHVYCLYRAH